jgi:hypothetical protein
MPLVHHYKDFEIKLVEMSTEEEKTKKFLPYYSKQYFDNLHFLQENRCSHFYFTKNNRFVAFTDNNYILKLFGIPDDSIIEDPTGNDEGRYHVKCIKIIRYITFSFNNGIIKLRTGKDSYVEIGEEIIYS